MRLAGRLMVMTGALAFVAITTLAPYVEVGACSRTFWDLMTRAPVILTVIAAVAFVLTVANLSAELVVPSAIASGLSFWLLGSFFFLTAKSYDAFGWGYCDRNWRSRSHGRGRGHVARRLSASPD